MTTTRRTPSEKLLVKLLAASISVAACDDPERTSPTTNQNISSTHGGAPSSTGGNGGSTAGTEAAGAAGAQATAGTSGSGGSGEAGGAAGQGGTAGSAGAAGASTCKDKLPEPWTSTQPSELFGCCEEKAAHAKGEITYGCCESFDQCFTPEMIIPKLFPGCEDESAIYAGSCPNLSCFTGPNFGICQGVIPLVQLPKQGDLCCYGFWKGSCCGRPISVEDTARRSSLTSRGDWG
jgi:hypothetical protein